MAFIVPSAVTTYLTNNKDTFPIRLFEIGGIPLLRFTDSDLHVSWNGETWNQKGISYSRVQLIRGFEISSYEISIDNVDDSMIAWALANDPTGYEVKVYKGFGIEPHTDPITLVGGWAGLLFKGRITKIEADEEFTITVKSAIDFHKQRGPRVMQHQLCRFQGPNGFKGVNCGYIGAETECNFTFRRCQELFNTDRFGGFPDISSKNDR
jgi:hypothetical protein